MAMVEQSTIMIEEREKEIRSIVQSISEINEMYRDLATMIVDQVREGPGEIVVGRESWGRDKIFPNKELKQYFDRGSLWWCNWNCRLWEEEEPRAKLQIGLIRVHV